MPTIPIGPGSAAVNAGSNIGNLTTDARGFARTVGSAPDIGAVERQAAPLVNSVIINGGAVQRSRVISITLVFTNQVNLAANAFTLTRPAFGTTSPTAATLSSAPTAGQGRINVTTAVNNGTTIATLTFATNAGSTTSIGDGVEYGSLSDGSWVLTVSAAGISNTDGVGMAADFATPGTGGIGSGRIYRLFGDHDGDADTDTLNAAQFRQAFGSIFGNTQAPFYNPSFDFDGDGDVDTTDAARFRQRFGQIV